PLTIGEDLVTLRCSPTEVRYAIIRSAFSHTGTHPRDGLATHRVARRLRLRTRDVERGHAQRPDVSDQAAHVQPVDVPGSNMELPLGHPTRTTLRLGSSRALPTVVLEQTNTKSNKGETMNVFNRERPETWPLQFFERSRLSAWPDDFLLRTAGQLAVVRD